MPAHDIDHYLADLAENERSTLQELRRSILLAAPRAQECISYGLPAFKVDGKTVAGFAAFKNHLSYLPHSGSVFAALSSELTDYPTTRGSLHFTAANPLPPQLVAALITARMTELGLPR